MRFNSRDNAPIYPSACRPGVVPRSAFRIPNSEFRIRKQRCAAFTLLELMVTIAIIGILASTVLFAMFNAQETARENKTKSLIMKLNNVVMPKYESYRTRRVPMLPPPLTTTSGATTTAIAGGVQMAAKYRLDALRDIMRMELPDRWTDITDAPIALAQPGVNSITIPRPAVSQAYLNTYNKAATPPTTMYQGAECLYLIITLGVTDNLGGRELFNEGNIGDTDHDGFKEFLDGWGNPISFLRWAPGFPSELGRQALGTIVSASGTSVVVTGSANAANGYGGSSLLVATGTAIGSSSTIASSSVSGSQTTFTLTTALPGSPSMGDTIYVMDPDPFDSRHIYGGGAPATFAIYPLIYSYGPDGIPDITTTNNGTLYDSAANNNNPFFALTSSSGTSILMGTPQDLPNLSDPANGMDNSKDNIHNHLIGTR